MDTGKQVLKLMIFENRIGLYADDIVHFLTDYNTQYRLYSISFKHMEAFKILKYTHVNLQSYYLKTLHLCYIVLSETF